MKNTHRQKKSSDHTFKKSLIALAIIGISQQAIAQDAADANTLEQEAEVTEVIEVKGIRGALASAADLKRESSTFVDSITASDANVLPDLSVAEALSRIPGVTVTRFTAGSDDFPSPEGSGNLVRGLGFVRSEFNGRDAFSANGGRALDWSAIPPELIGGVDVYKNQSADLIEGGIGGLVNLRTLEPFDKEGRVFIFAADSTYTDLREEWSPSFSLVLGDRWETSKGEFGLLGSYSTSDLKSKIHGYQTPTPNPRDNLTQDVFTGDYIPEAGSVVAVPQGFQLRTNSVDRTRESMYLAGQWRSPDDNMELSVKYIRVDNESSSVEQTTESFTDFNSWNRFELSDVVVSPFTSEGIARCNGNNENPVGFCDELIPVTGGLMEEGWLTDTGDSWFGAYGLQVSNLGVGKQQTSLTDDISFNFKWRPTDGWMVELDAHRTTAEATRDELWVGSNSFMEVFIRPDLDDPYLEFRHDPRLNLGSIYDEGQNQVAWSYPTGTNDPGSYFMPFISDGFARGDGELTAVRGDITYDFDDSEWFESVKFGARYSERQQTNKEAGMNWQGVSQAWNGGMAMYGSLDTPAHEVVDFSDFFRGGVVGGENTEFVYIDSNYLRNPHQFFNFFENEPDYANSGWNAYTLNGNPRRTTDGNFTPIFQPDDISDIVEETINLYVRLDFYHAFSDGTDIVGNFGVRYTRTETKSDGMLTYQAFPVDEDGTLTDPDYPQEAEDRDSPQDFLPDTDAYLKQASTERLVDVSDDHFLPSLNVKWNLSDEMLIRFGVSKAVTRPNIQDMRAGQRISAGVTRLSYEPLPEDHPDFGIPRGAQDILLRSINVNGGNPDLKATEAVNWDLSFEWYFDDGDYFSAAVFRKDLENIISYGPEIRDTIALDGVSANYQYIGPINQSDAEITGMELSYQDFFDELPGLFSNLGVQANYTYIDASATPPPAFLDADGDGQPDEGSFANNLRFGRDDLLGQSRHTTNLTGIYQDDNFEFRLAYSWRSEYLNNYRDWITGDPLLQDAGGFLDASFRYDITDNVQFNINAANILDHKSKSKVQLDDANQTYIRSSFLNDRRLKLSIRYVY